MSPKIFIFAARAVVILHFCVVICFLGSPFLPLPIQIFMVLAGILTQIFRFLFFKGDCPLTRIERNLRNRGGDRESPIHQANFMPVYFRIPDRVFDPIEKLILFALVAAIIFQIFAGKPFWLLLF